AEKIEEILIAADVGALTAQSLLAEMRQSLRGTVNAEQAISWLKKRSLDLLSEGKKPFAADQQPLVILMIGVNGVGKTTTIGKLASYFCARGKRVLLVAGDTYRAAAVAQLNAWGERVGCEVVHGAERADPSAVIFDAIRKGVS